ncbi:hypothetical protein [Diaminobutyricimonas sp. LJ205]|uniref:hypothetical protein n=1 Tax=Diaminobutyricimonas sp. LJ205 TaxID=2683590 RepID=UPI0012F4A091|nr:hypothetical protein [Diaminobutyricimonas sp. LJ205]
MAVTRGRRTVDDFRLDVPENWYPLPLGEDFSPKRWARETVEDAARLGSIDQVPAVLTDLEQHAERFRVQREHNPWLSAVVMMRIDETMSVGALLHYQLVTLGDGDGPDAFEAQLAEFGAQYVPGMRVRALESWRAPIAAGELVGAHYLIESREVGEAGAWVEQRTLFGVFPPGAVEMFMFTFTSSDFAAFDDMRAETQAIIESLQVDLVAA